MYQESYLAIVPGDRVEFDTVEASKVLGFPKVKEIRFNYHVKVTGIRDGLSTFPFIEFVPFGIAGIIPEDGSIVTVTPEEFKVSPGLTLRPMDYSAFSGFYPAFRSVKLSLLTSGKYSIEVTI